MDYKTEKKIEEYEEKGFLFLQQWTQGFYVPDRFKLPSGTIFDRKELSNYLRKNKLEFGNELHIELRELLKYLDLIEYSGENYPGIEYPSFLDSHDEFNCIRKYKWKEKIKFS